MYINTTNTLNNSFEEFFVELNLQSKKWLLGCPYNHNKDNTPSPLSNVRATLDKLCRDYENIILVILIFEAKEKKYV